MIEVTRHGFEVIARAPAVVESQVTLEQFAKICTEVWDDITGSNVEFEPSSNPFLHGSIMRVSAQTQMKITLNLTIASSDKATLTAILSDGKSDWDLSCQCAPTPNALKHEMHKLVKARFIKLRDSQYIERLRTMLEFIERSAS